MARSSMRVGQEPAPSPRAGRGTVALALALITGAFFAAGYHLPPILSGGAGNLEAARAFLPQPAPVPAFLLHDQHGHGFTRERLIGKRTLVVFGYTHCPDHCAAALQTAIGALDRASRRGVPPSSLQAVFVSVDPRRDTPARLRDYLARVDPRVVGLSGDAGTTARLARSLGVVYERRASGTDGGYIVDHTSAVLLVGPDAHLLAGFALPVDSRVVAAGLEAVSGHRAADI